MKNRKCYNCIHGGKQIKIVGNTHLHCENPKYTAEMFESGQLTGWDTLMNFYDSCEDHQLKINVKPQNCTFTEITTPHNPFKSIAQSCQ